MISESKSLPEIFNLGIENPEWFSNLLFSNDNILNPCVKFKKIFCEEFKMNDSD